VKRVEHKLTSNEQFWDTFPGQDFIPDISDMFQIP